MIAPRPLKNSAEIASPQGETIRCDIRAPAGSRSLPVVIICHSFMAFKDWGFFPFVADRIAGEGFVTVIFNFSRNGVSGDGDRITDFGKFSTNSFSVELGDLGSVVKAVREDRAEVIVSGGPIRPVIGLYATAPRTALRLLASRRTRKFAQQYARARGRL